MLGTRVRYVSTFRVTTIPAVDQILKFVLLLVPIFDPSGPPRAVPTKGSFLSNSLFIPVRSFSLGTNPVGFVCPAARDRQHSNCSLSLSIVIPSSHDQVTHPWVCPLPPSTPLVLNASLAASVPNTTRMWSSGPRKIRANKPGARIVGEKVQPGRLVRAFVCV